jgi:hypothetical protein
MVHKESGLSFERVVFFSDAVFAIVIRSLVVPLACVAAILLSLISIRRFILIPLLARLLDPTRRQTEEPPASETADEIATCRLIEPRAS